MKLNSTLSRPSTWVALLALGPLLSLAPGLIAADDNVIIPKSRLEELERKERELQKLQGDLYKTKGENLQLKKQHETDAAKIAATPAAEPVVTHVSPAIATLPPLKEGEVVDAMDLANHYRTEAAAADQRYRKHSFRVRGEVVGFEKSMFSRTYTVLLKTPDRQMKVICDIFPPEIYKAVVKAKRGSEIVATPQDERKADVVLVKEGNTVEVSGECKGVEDSIVRMAHCQLLSVK